MADDVTRQAKAFLDYLERKYPGDHAVCREATLAACGIPVARMLRVLFSEIFDFALYYTQPREPSATEILRGTLDDLRSCRESLDALQKKLSRSRAKRDRHLRPLLVSSTQELDTLIEKLAAATADA